MGCLREKIKCLMKQNTNTLGEISAHKQTGLEECIMNRGGFSWKTLLGVTAAKRNFARKTGIPTSKSGLYQKIGRLVIQAIFGKK